jgi:putative nucleotidyltransferase with HDIG domain
MRPSREQAWETLTRYTTSEALLRHALAVEASVAFYARLYGEDEELWRATALLHDFDYEIHPTLDEHPQDGAPILRDEGYPDELIEAVLSHAEHLAMPRDTQLKKVLFACDELSGFVHACGLVRPTGLDGLEPKSVKKKLKQPSTSTSRTSSKRCSRSPPSSVSGRQPTRPRSFGTTSHPSRDRCVPR